MQQFLGEYISFQENYNYFKELKPISEGDATIFSGGATIFVRDATIFMGGATTFKGKYNNF